MEYQFDKENGVIRDKVTGDRCVIITRARMEQIFSRLSDLFQSGAQVIITEACKVAGERYVAEVPAETKADPALFLKTAVKRFTDAGLGRIEIVEFKPEEAELTFRIWNNFFAEIHNEEPTYCNCVEAFVSGMYERIIFKTPKIKKTKCVGKGDAYCEWHLAP
jgi:predicted hydrocarbon binding protein